MVAEGGQFGLFPWREEEPIKGHSRRLPRPTVDVQLLLGEAQAAEKALVDTGSPRCVFSRGAAVWLGIDLPEMGSDAQEIHKLKFMDHEWEAVPQTVTLRLPPFEGLEWDAEVDFVLEESLPFGLLGHEGFLDRWAVSFNAYHSYFVVEPVEALHARLPVDTFRAWQEEWPDYN
jgi:hypothetical protein